MAETVIVGCKLPMGFLLRVEDTVIRLNGSSLPVGLTAGQRKAINTDVAAADGLTIVDKSFWETWLKSHQEYTPVKTGHIYASKSRNDAVARAEDTKTVKTGLEPLEPTKIKGIEPNDIMKEKQ